MDPDTIAKIIGAIGLTGALGTGLYFVWTSWRADVGAAKAAGEKLDAERLGRISAAETRLDAERAARIADAKAAQDKLDAFQDAEIKRQAELIKALSGSKEAA